MISVVITTFNGEKYIIEQLNSIMNQSIKPDEVIICDDRSVDQTPKLIRQFIRENNLQNNWKLFINEKSLGFVNNFISAIKKTKGDFIFLSDQDDVFLPDKFKVMLEFFQNNDDCLVLNANYSIIGENLNNSRMLTPKRKTKKLEFEELFYHSNYPGFSIGFKKEVIEYLKEINYEGIYGHDILVNLLGLEKNGVYQLSQVLSLYRIHDNNTSNVGNTVSNYNIDIRILQKQKELEEYEKLIELMELNCILKSKIYFIELRRKQLMKRIECLKGKKILPLLSLLFKKVYPKRTIVGDILFVFKNMKERT